jgi:N-acetyl-anhydromuramyl-L-alanine amidase AmpD
MKTNVYHAGVSSGEVIKFNDTSIGIEIVNAGFTTDAAKKSICSF